MKIRNVNPLGAVEVPILRRVVEADEVIVLRKELAEQLLEQTSNWARVAPESRADGVDGTDNPQED